MTKGSFGRWNINSLHGHSQILPQCHFFRGLETQIECPWMRGYIAGWYDIPKKHCDGDRHVLDHTIRELGETYGEASATKGDAGIAFIVASGDAADRLSRYIKRKK